MKISHGILVEITSNSYLSHGGVVHHSGQRVRIPVPLARKLLSDKTRPIIRALENIENTTPANVPDN